MKRFGTSAFKVVTTMVITLSLLTIAVIMASSSFGFMSTTIDRSGPALLEEIRDLEDFTAAEGNFSEVVDIETDTRFLPDFISGERVVAIVTGSVRATVDFSGLDEGSIEVDQESGTIRITLPEPVLGDPDIDEKSVRFFRERGLTDRIEDFLVSNPTDDSPVFLAAEGKISEAANESELPDRARANTELWLTAFLEAAGFENVIITWR